MRGAGPRAAPAPRPSAYLSLPPLRPPGRRLPSLGPGSRAPHARVPGPPAPSEPSLTAPAAPGVSEGAAARDPPLQPRAALCKPGGVWTPGEERGTRRALSSAGGKEGGRRRPQRHRSPGRRGLGGGTGTLGRGPFPTPDPDLRPAPPRLLSGTHSCARRAAFPPLGPRLHAPLPRRASLALTCSSLQ